MGVRTRRRRYGRAPSPRPTLELPRVLAATVVSLVIVLTTLTPVASAIVRCRPGSIDSDRDSIPDCWERRNGLVIGSRDQLTDKDRDGLLAVQEFRLDAVTGGIFGPYRANDPNSDDDGGLTKDVWTPPTLDGWEDFDRDGFVNTAERAWKTSLARAASHPDLPENGCVRMPAGVAHDGSINVSLLLQAVVDTVPDGRCVRFRANGRYRHDGTLRIVGRNDLTIDGNGAVLFTDRPGRIAPGAANSRRPHLQLVAVSNLTIEDLTIDGPNRSGEYREIYEAEHGFDIKGSTGVVIRASHVRQVYGDFVYVDDAGWPIGSGINVPTSDLLVSGNWFRTAGRHGLGVGGRATGVRFEGNIVRRVHRSGVDFELNPERTISDFEIVGNTFRDFRLNWIAAGEGGATDMYFGWNRILGDSMHSKIGPRTEPYIHERWVFEGNVSDTEHEGDRTVFFLQHVHDFTFVANVQPMYPGGGGRVFGIFGDVCGITLIDNVFANYKELFYPEEPPSC